MPINTQPLATQTYHLLLKEILSGKRKEGQRISEESLCAEYGISRTPAREALMRLASDGLVERTARKGCRVCEIDRKKQKEIFECRALLESLILKLGFDYIPKDKLLKIHAELERAIATQSAEISLKADDMLHNLIIEACPNRSLVGIVIRLQQQCNAFRSLRSVSTDVTDITEERMKIVQAILDGDKKSARNLLRLHILQGVLKS